MRRHGDKIVLSASDLMRFQGCAHATALDLRLLKGEPLVPAEDTASAQLIQAKGDAHEHAFLETLKASSASVYTVNKDALNFEQAVEATQTALRDGPDWIYQAALAGTAWGGYADFLERVPRASKLGDFSYEVIDTKLKRSPDPKHVLQLALYSDLLAEVQGIEPAHIHVVLGDGRRVTLRLADYASYVRHLRRHLEDFIAKPDPTRPEPVAACTLCRWREHCASEWEKTDNLCLVAGIRKGQRLKLEAAGLTTIGGLASHSGKVADLTTETLDKLCIQARLQQARRAGGPPQFEARTIEVGKGLERLPKPADGDLFFDMEGDPLINDGLEYLFGVYWKEKGVGTFKPFWAHEREQERKATAEVLAFFAQHLRAHPDAHIYHYNHYEVTALKRLVSAHGVGEAILDQLLREVRFVDLYRIVQQGLIASEPGYSLKNLEVFYAEKRTEEVVTAGDSIVVYERWRETQDPALLDNIRAYNETDCRSTEGLRDWLITSVRPKGLAWPEPVDLTAKIEAPDARAQREDEEREQLRQRFAALTGPLKGAPAELLFELMWFHEREDKPKWWAMFDRAERETDELIDDLDSLGGLVAFGPARPDKRSLVQTYRYPEQETKLQQGMQVKTKNDLATVTITRLDPQSLEVDVKFGPKAGTPPDKVDLIPGGPLNNMELRGAARRVAEDVVTGGQRYPAIEALLAKQHPRLVGLKAGAPLVQEGADLVSETIAAVGHLDRSTLPIQGPPGTGKTYVSSHAILALIRDGKRVAVTSHSHKAIDNLLLAVAERAREAHVNMGIMKKISNGEAPDDPAIESTTDNDDPRLSSYPLVGGTAWLFAREEFDQKFDTLFVDEAGQVSLANIVAAGTAAHNIVLVGDPMQLAQPIQGTHPGQSGSSALAYILDDASTVPSDRGIFLPVSRRMHPLVCGYISCVVYDGRLTSDDGAARQELVLKEAMPPLVPAGLRFAPVVHEGNGQSSKEEASAVRDAYRALIGQSFRDRDGKVREIGSTDILIVTPYNAQVNLLKRTLPAGARVGTVDKFQGQEAPVCLVSMATSSNDELPRNIEFLFSVNRLNVAISRAQALAVVFANPRLLDVPCRTIEQMRLVNALCAVADYAAKSPSPGPS